MIRQVPGAVLLVFLCLVRLEQAHTVPTAFLLALQSGLAAILLVLNKPARRASVRDSWLGWGTALLPLAVRADGASTLSALPGLLLALWSLTVLGLSFSVVPQDRGIVSRGPYRLVRHPMYLGELLSLLGLCFSTGLGWNWCVSGLFAVLTLLRIRAEERVIEGYAGYADMVRWRLLPFVW